MSAFTLISHHLCPGPESASGTARAAGWNWQPSFAYVLVTLASFALMAAATPSQAKPMNTCKQRHLACTERCIIAEVPGKDNTKQDSCIKRTCDHQLKACMGGSRDVGESERSEKTIPRVSRSGRIGGRPRKKTVVRDKRRSRVDYSPRSDPAPKAQPSPARTTGPTGAQNGNKSPIVRDHRAGPRRVRR